MCHEQIILSQTDENLSNSNPKPDPRNINAHTKFGEYPFIFTQVIVLKPNTDRPMNDRLIHRQPMFVCLC